MSDTRPSEADRPGQERRPDMGALAIAAGLAIISVVIAWNTATMGGVASYSRVGPTAFPYAIAAVLFVLAIWTAVEAWRGDFPEREADNIPPILWIVGGLAAQMLLLKVAGFSIATGLLFALTARGFGRGPLWKTVPIGIVISLAIWFIFSRGLQLSLPAGPLENLL
ncbi:putative tricarboxylic transport membrane protein [Pseudaminobacter salicylatoxidans]|uniref:Putative tricarboxylic transport membrane protein n=1 Tax=Pseudaminobacter salicylatoxidans TaxID=93369 RepID=A0A316CLQ8_PSESE|nr:tripartite tricarboxylate transporter TctB family protein [Pseudaminobacter salicylatoxidans]PWJ80966.1 putative tricarboxylic transport membrane protein [Pseudaminobacter salicylatoxidans]